MLHAKTMMEFAKTSSKGYLKNLFESFKRGQGQLCILFLILLNPSLIWVSQVPYHEFVYETISHDSINDVLCHVIWVKLFIGLHMSLLDRR